MGIFRLNAQPISGSLWLHERVIVQSRCNCFVISCFLGRPPPQTPRPVNNFDIQTIKSTYLFMLLTLRESSLDMTSATASVSAVPVPRLCKNIQEVNEHVYAVLGTH